HHRQPDGAPPRRLVAFQVIGQTPPPAGLPDAVNGNPDHRADQDEIVESSHANARDSSASRMTQVTKVASTKTYTARHDRSSGRPVPSASSGRSLVSV